MNQEQKALYRQAQLAGLGLVIAAVGLFAGHAMLPWIGLFVFVFGLARCILIRLLIRKTEAWQTDDPDQDPAAGTDEDDQDPDK